MSKLQFTPEMIEEFKKAQAAKATTKAKDEDRYTAVSDSEDWIDPDYDHGHGDDFDALVQEALTKQGKGVSKNGR